MRVTTVMKSTEDYFENLSNKLTMMMWTGLIWLRTGSKGGIFEGGNEPSVSIHGWEFFD
jgi:hypothetical protein